jgi:hypothetical protein
MTAAANTFNAVNFISLVKTLEPVIRFIWVISRFMVAPSRRIAGHGDFGG